MSIETLLPETLLADIRQRAADYDRENCFFTEDLEALAETGYLAAAVPAEFGGGDLSLTELARAQRRLAAAAPATALGVNMHLVWSAVAKLLYDRGDRRMDWVCRDTVAGHVFAFGISEPGNDAVLLNADTTASPCEGGFLVTGSKVFTTLSPVWTRLGIHARHGDDLLFGFIRRDSEVAVRGVDECSAGLSAGTIETVGEWNPLGMRATQSWNTRLDGVLLEEDAVVTRAEPMNPSDPVMWGIFVAFSTLTAAVYAGIADRALELARESARREHRFVDGSVAAFHTDPDVSAKLTESTLAHQRAIATLELLTRDADAKTERADWFLALGAMRNDVTDTARHLVTEALRIVGTRGYQADSELSRLYRDVLAGLFHPTSARSLAATVRRTFG